MASLLPPKPSGLPPYAVTIRSHSHARSMTTTIIITIMTTAIIITTITTFPAQLTNPARGISKIVLNLDLATGEFEFLVIRVRFESRWMPD